MTHPNFESPSEALGKSLQAVNKDKEILITRFFVCFFKGWKFRAMFCVVLVAGFYVNATKTMKMET